MQFYLVWVVSNFKKNQADIYLKIVRMFLILDSVLLKVMKAVFSEENYVPQPYIYPWS